MASTLSGIGSRKSRSRIRSLTASSNFAKFALSISSQGRPSCAPHLDALALTAAGDIKERYRLGALAKRMHEHRQTEERSSADGIGQLRLSAHGANQRIGNADQACAGKCWQIPAPVYQTSRKGRNGTSFGREYLPSRQQGAGIAMTLPILGFASKRRRHEQVNMLISVCSRLP